MSVEALFVVCMLEKCSKSGFYRSPLIFFSYVCVIRNDDGNEMGEKPEPGKYDAMDIVCTIVNMIDATGPVKRPEHNLYAYRLKRYLHLNFYFRCTLRLRSHHSDANSGEFQYKLKHAHSGETLACCSLSPFQKSPSKVYARHHYISIICKFSGASFTIQSNSISIILEFWKRTLATWHTHDDDKTTVASRKSLSLR